MNSNINPLMSVVAWTMLIILSILWGGSFFFVAVALVDFPPLTLVMLRVAIAAVVLWGFIFAMGVKIPRQPKVWGAFLVMGLLNNVIPFVLIVWGQTQIASGLASILNAATPIFTLVIAAMLLPDERATPLKLIGITIGFIGVVVMIGVPAIAGSDTLFAQLAVVVATVSYALAGVFGRRFKVMAINPLITAAGQVTASALVLAPIAFWQDGPLDIGAASIHAWGAILGLAIFSTAVAYVLYFKILEVAGATNLLLVTLLVPVSAIILGVLFLGESLAWLHVVGMALIALGLSAIDGRIWQRYSFVRRQSKVG